MASTEPILGQYEANALASKTGTDRVATDKDTFLKLLVAQLTHQDPLNPVEDKEFIAQLAQFTTVEELQNLNTGMESLNSAYLRQQSVSASGLIGRYVKAPGDQITITSVTDEEGKVARYGTSTDFELPRDAAKVRIDVYALDAEGNPSRMVASHDLGSRTAGEQPPWKWNGLDASGAAVSDGIYSATVVATDVDGQPIYVTPTSFGRVIRVELADDNNHKLMLADGRSVYFNDIKIVDDATIYESSGGTSGEDDASGGGGSTGGDSSGGTTGNDSGGTTADGTN